MRLGTMLLISDGCGLMPIVFNNADNILFNHQNPCRYYYFEPSLYLKYSMLGTY